MSYTTIYENVVFIEGSNKEATILGEVKSDLSFKFGAQLKNLNDVKKDMAIKARALGGNCILNFNYGQKSRWLAIDDVAFYGNGKVAILPENIYQELLNKVRSR